MNTKDIFAIKNWKEFYNNFVLELFALEYTTYNHLQSMIAFSIFSYLSTHWPLFASIHNGIFVKRQFYFQTRPYFSFATFVCCSIPVQTPLPCLPPATFFLCKIVSVILSYLLSHMMFRISLPSPKTLFVFQSKLRLIYRLTWTGLTSFLPFNKVL